MTRYACYGCGAEPMQRHDASCPVMLRNLSRQAQRERTIGWYRTGIVAAWGLGSFTVAGLVTGIIHDPARIPEWLALILIGTANTGIGVLIWCGGVWVWRGLKRWF